VQTEGQAVANAHMAARRAEDLALRGQGWDDAYIFEHCRVPADKDRRYLLTKLRSEKDGATPARSVCDSLFDVVLAQAMEFSALITADGQVRTEDLATAVDTACVLLRGSVARGALPIEDLLDPSNMQKLLHALDEACTSVGPEDKFGLAISFTNLSAKNQRLGGVGVWTLMLLLSTCHGSDATGLRLLQLISLVQFHNAVARILGAHPPQWSTTSTSCDSASLTSECPYIDTCQHAQLRPAYSATPRLALLPKQTSDAKKRVAGLADRQIKPQLENEEAPPVCLSAALLKSNGDAKKSVGQTGCTKKNMVSKTSEQITSVVKMLALKSFSVGVPVKGVKFCLKRGCLDTKTDERVSVRFGPSDITSRSLRKSGYVGRRFRSDEEFEETANKSNHGPRIAQFHYHLNLYQVTFECEVCPHVPNAPTCAYTALLSCGSPQAVVNPTMWQYHRAHVRA
jgi:hypothetical protein